MKEINRRSFIKNSATVLGASVLPQISNSESLITGTTPQYNTTPVAINVKPKKIIIGGAGIGGMCCAYELMKRGHEVIVMEASGRHGGHVYTAKDGLSDGLYGDYGQEHITKPGYDRYWGYIQEFNLTALPYPRRNNLLRRIDGKFYTEEMLADPAVLKKFGFNQRETDYLSKNPWWNFRSLFIRPYLEKFKDEYQPFQIGYDHLDTVPMGDIYKKEGASETALRFLGDKNNSALFELWQAAILHLRGVPLVPPQLFRLKGGNQMLPNAFAQRLGNRVWLNCPITSIQQGTSGVTVSYKHHNQPKQMEADYFVNCIGLPDFRKIPVSPALPPEKQYVLDHVTYDSYQRFVFQASSKFWEEDNLSINMDLDHPDLWSVWQSAEEVDTHRVIVLGTGPGGISPQRALAAFRSVYPGKADTIEQVVSKDWTKETFASTCERLPFPMGELHKFWPEVMKPHGRIHFAGAYADNLNWGTEAATRSANRVAETIDKLD